MRARRNEEFVERALGEFGGQVYRLALGQTRSDADAQDVVQDAFIALLGCPKRFRDREHLRAWLLRVALNRCRELARSAWRRRVQTVDDPCLLDVASAGFRDEDPLEGLAGNPVWEALGRLPEKLRAAAQLHYVEGLSCKEVADALGVPATTVRTRLYRARAALRAELAGEADAGASGRPGDVRAAGAGDVRAERGDS